MEIETVEENRMHAEKNQLLDDLDSIYIPNEHQSNHLEKIAKAKVKDTRRKLRKLAIAPGEMGKFKNWGDEIYLEEMAFPEKFPYGQGGYLSSCINNDIENDKLGFAAYCVNQLMSADPKFRQDLTYVFFLLLVKEQIILMRCKLTYLRQARRLPELTKSHLLNLNYKDLVRYNRSFQVFKTLRGSQMYFEESKKHVMAMLRQLGCPSLFLTLSSAEFDWKELLKEIAETVYRRSFTEQEIEELSSKERNKLIADNVIQSTLHFQKRVDKLFALMQYDFFKCGDKIFHVDTYYFRVEYQQRGSPHIHSLLWLKDQENKDAPSFWYNKNEEKSKVSDTATSPRKNKLSRKKHPKINEKDDPEQNLQKVQQIQEFADFLLSTSPNDISCGIHVNNKSKGLN